MKKSSCFQKAALGTWVKCKSLSETWSNFEISKSKGVSRGGITNDIPWLCPVFFSRFEPWKIRVQISKIQKIQFFKSKVTFLAGSSCKKLVNGRNSGFTKTNKKTLIVPTYLFIFMSKNSLFWDFDLLILSCYCISVLRIIKICSGYS